MVLSQEKVVTLKGGVWL